MNREFSTDAYLLDRLGSSLAIPIYQSITNYQPNLSQLTFVDQNAYEQEN